MYKQNIISGKISAIELIDSLLLVSNKKKLFIINTNNYKLDSIYLPKKHNTIIKLFKLKNNRLVAYSSSGGLLFFDEKFKIVSVIQLNASEKVGIEQYNQFLFLTQPFINNRGIVRIDLNSLFNNKIKLHDKVKYYKAEFTYTQNQIINNDKLERQTSYLNNIKNQIQRLVEIINGVVTLNKSGDKFNDAVIMPVEMSTFIKEIIKDFKIYDTQCIVNFIKVHDKDIVCKIDKETFKNAFNNILSNAIKYYYRDTEIDVTISIDKNNNCKIIVRNLGIGIIQDELDKVFDIFFRGSNVGNTPGLGTGLPMAKEFIRFNNGDIKIESYVNEYVNVIITLPLYKEELVEIV